MYTDQLENSYKDDGVLARLSLEASDTLTRLGEHLSEDAVRFLKRLVALA